MQAVELPLILFVKMFKTLPLSTADGATLKICISYKTNGQMSFSGYKIMKNIQPYRRTWIKKTWVRKLAKIGNLSRAEVWESCSSFSKSADNSLLFENFLKSFIGLSSWCSLQIAELNFIRKTKFYLSFSTLGKFSL